MVTVTNLIICGKIMSIIVAISHVMLPYMTHSHSEIMSVVAAAVM